MLGPEELFGWEPLCEEHNGNAVKTQSKVVTEIQYGLMVPLVDSVLVGLRVDGNFCLEH